MKEYLGIEATWLVVALIVTGVVGWLDLATGYEISFSIFYLVPVALATWKSGRVGSVVVSIASAGTWLLVETSLRSPAMFKWVGAHVPMPTGIAKMGPAYSNPLTPYWNAGVRLGFFLIIAFLLTGRREDARKRRLPRDS